MVDLLGYLGGVFLMISFLPQIFKSMRTRSMTDLSWGTLAASGLSGAFYEAYAFFLGLTPVLIMNGVFVASIICAMVMKYQFDRSMA
ncbi:PQ loop repeat protein [Falsiruegeria litorea R37]|uniref:PQ loop repeat protein n=1 Tax=Falsiruegeria litorea R37 TaxID=1200284 RepID=A0A1Y5RLD1_9RHOB|nr:PQ-loop repeat-containing protein [Falsiruegeria litorea]SLN20019.1 PQ loop repeat protein [Falsiruegeria litorea R37]